MNVQPLKYVKRGLTLPEELWEFVVQQAQQPLYAGNVSAYLRALIVERQRLVQRSGPNGAECPSNELVTAR